MTTNIVTEADGAIHGPVDVTEARHYRIAGFVHTSHGRVVTEVTGDIRFGSHQQFDITDTTYHQQIRQRTTILTRTTTIGGGPPSEQLTQHDWPLTVDFAFVVHDDGTQAQTTSIDQKFERSDTTIGGGRLFDFRVVSNHVAPSDTLNFDAAGVFVGSTGQVSEQQYFAADARGHCFSRDLTAAGGVLTSVVDGRECGH